MRLHAITKPTKRPVHQLSRVVRKAAFCICENKDADQLRGNREADLRHCFRYTDSTIPLLAKSKISRLKLSSVVVQPGLCWTWSETPKTGFLRTRLNLGMINRSAKSDQLFLTLNRKLRTHALFMWTENCKI